MKTVILTALVVTGFALTASAQTTITVPAPAPAIVTAAPALGPPAKYIHSFPTRRSSDLWDRKSVV